MVNLKNSVIMLMSTVCLFPILNVKYNKADTKTIIGIIDVLYYFLWLFCLEEVVYFAWFNISNWHNRLVLNIHRIIFNLCVNKKIFV